MTTKVDYDELNAELLALHAGVLASECHGFMCGCFCASNSVATEIWQEYLLSGMDEEADLDDCFTLLLQLAKQVPEEVFAEDITFTLLLPDDESTNSERSAALAEWSAGFISGLGIGGLGDMPKLIEECEEFIKDLVSISRMETTADDSEDAEAAIFEIVEYIRVGVIMLHQEWHPSSGDSAKPEVLH